MVSRAIATLVSLNRLKGEVMNREHVTIFATFLIVILGLATISAKVGVSPGQENRGLESQGRFASLNSKARLAEGGDETAIRELADEVFNQFASPEMTSVLSPFKDRLVLAEVNYRLQGKGGVSEKSVVQSLNKLTKQLGSPDYARVSTGQVRYLRVNLMGAFPSFFSQPTAHVDLEMSPLEAVGLTLVLVTQKLSNEDFQVTPEEWAARRHQKQVEKWEVYRAGKPTVVEPEAKARVVIENSKSKELERVFQDSDADMMPLIEGLLTDMGISR
jgi:hypothetical protein